MDQYDGLEAGTQQQWEHEMNCKNGCLPSTSLFKLCPECADKAWHYGNVMSKRDRIEGPRGDPSYDARMGTDGLEFRTTAGWRRENERKYGITWSKE